MRNSIAYSGLPKNRNNFIDLDRLVFAQTTKNTISRNIFEDHFSEVTEYIKEFIQEDYKDLLQNSFGNEEKKRQLRNVIYSHVSQQSFIEKFKSYIEGYELGVITDRLVEKIAGLGVLQELAATETITDINCIAWNNIWVDDINKGKYKTDVSFENPEEYLELCNRFAFASNKTYSYAKPSVNAYFPQLRVNFVGQDLSPSVNLQIRTISKELRYDEDYILGTGFATKEMVDFLKATFKTEGHLISGETGTGKTELLRYFMGYSKERSDIIVIEDTPETYLDEIYPLKPIKMWKNREATDDQNNSFGYDYHLANALRHNPDYIIIQESRGKEALQISIAASTGHKVNTTLHADNAPDSVERFIQMCQMEQHHPADYFGKRIVKGFRIGVHVKRFENVRKINQIVEYVGYENNEPIVNVLFEYNPLTDKHEVKGNVSEKLWGRLASEKTADLSNIECIKPRSAVGIM
ncbi:ATPase, T2SS/T4P/T4SS family [Terribacillus saccharophilus]|uniref:ATPase, T2SS/T4P/T4SS family n=1 Tax=Terribacillus saccharophilus TaxID=361277 RepID=UPI002989FD83|nr:ATPase, T2SS/T4P/T4SS family [Terribacillus saccharophilus]MCM3227704.1 Flp pilus assembly complex ATPase component TadA [Terribacillus saccharophilus]